MFHTHIKQEADFYFCVFYLSSVHVCSCTHANADVGKRRGLSAPCLSILQSGKLENYTGTMAKISESRVTGLFKSTQ